MSATLVAGELAAAHGTVVSYTALTDRPAGANGHRPSAATDRNASIQHHSRATTSPAAHEPGPHRASARRADAQSTILSAELS
ncbi:hypothetical protein JOD54_000060 [Actinokineospora baliensis]|nr:hypothetical protein [Actinokineospora baliensis]